MYKKAKLLSQIKNLYTNQYIFPKIKSFRYKKSFQSPRFCSILHLSGFICKEEILSTESSRDSQVFDKNCPMQVFKTETEVKLFINLLIFGKKRIRESFKAINIYINMFNYTLINYTCKNTRGSCQLSEPMTKNFYFHMKYIVINSLMYNYFLIIQISYNEEKVLGIYTLVYLL